jgi:hypothetical protein
MDIKQAAKIMKALSHPNRLEIYLGIVKGEQDGFEADTCECCVSLHWPLCGSALDADDGSLLEADPHLLPSARVSSILSLY